MHNKKIKSSVVALALGALIIGGAFAWLHGSDSVTNKFLTAASSPNPENKNGLEIYEVFKVDNNGNAAIKTNGESVDKKAQVRNESDYDSLIKVDFTKTFAEGVNHVDNDKIQLGLLDANVITENDITVDAQGEITNLDNIKGKWVKIAKVTSPSQVDDYDYYYIGNVAPKGFTTQILDNVSLNNDINTNPNYKNVGFDVVVNAKSIQSTEEAITDTQNNGFGLDKTEHSKLVKALIAVTNGASGTATQIPQSQPTK